jgi:hypothetical protein
MTNEQLQTENKELREQLRLMRNYLGVNGLLEDFESGLIAIKTNPDSDN